MRCENCGAQMVAGAAFCPSCGKQVATSRPGGTALASGGLQPNVAAALCYPAGFVTGILFLRLEPYRCDRFVRFHAFQSIFFSLAWVVLHFALGIFLSVLPWTLWHLVATASWLLSLTLFCAAIFLMYKAYNNERLKLPILGGLADKQAQRAVV